MAQISLFLVLFTVITLLPVVISSSIYFALRTWLTEPGICLKSEKEEEPPPETSENQRKVANLMVCVRNDKIDLITVISIPFVSVRNIYLRLHIW